MPPATATSNSKPREREGGKMRYLYLMVDGECCKIGHSNNPFRRSYELYYESRDLGAIDPAPIVAAWPLGEAAKTVESYLVKKLRRLRRRSGYEYFTISRREMVREIRAAFRLFGVNARAIHRRKTKDGRLAGWRCRHSFKAFGDAEGGREITVPQKRFGGSGRPAGWRRGQTKKNTRD